MNTQYYPQFSMYHDIFCLKSEWFLHECTNQNHYILWETRIQNNIKFQFI